MLEIKVVQRMAGRPKKPKNLVNLQGNPGRRGQTKPAKKQASKTAPPKPPHWLDRKAKPLFTSLARALTDRGVLEPGDELGLAILADMVSMYRDVRKIRDDRKKALAAIAEGERKKHRDYNGETYTCITEAGSMMFRTYPENPLIHERYRLIFSALEKYGLTPASRSKVDIAGPEDEADPMAQILSGRGS